MTHSANHRRRQRRRIYITPAWPRGRGAWRLIAYSRAISRDLDSGGIVEQGALANMGGARSCLKFKG
ncbi:hypothetical protein FKM82_010494 [Ascaphus truei]